MSSVLRELAGKAEISWHDYTHIRWPMEHFYMLVWLLSSLKEFPILVLCVFVWGWEGLTSDLFESGERGNGQRQKEVTCSGWVTGLNLNLDWTWTCDDDLWPPGYLLNPVELCSALSSIMVSNHDNSTVVYIWELLKAHVKGQIQAGWKKDVEEGSYKTKN